MAEEGKLTSGDWELSEDFYRDEEKELSLEDFIVDRDSMAEPGIGVPETDKNHDELLKKTAEDVHRVSALSSEGHTIEQIAALTGLEKQYVYNILVCAQGFREDDEIAVAHLVLG